MAHQDVDVAVLRADQKQLHQVFCGWELYYATTDHRLLPDRSDRWLEVPLHGVWVRPASDAPWLCEFLLNEHEDQQWVYRRNPAVRKPLAEVGVKALGRVPARTLARRTRSRRSRWTALRRGIPTNLEGIPSRCTRVAVTRSRSTAGSTVFCRVSGKERWSFRPTRPQCT